MKTVPLIFLDSFRQRFLVHAKFRVGRNLAQAALAETERNYAFINRRMRLFGGVDAQQWKIFATAHALLANAQIGALAGGSDRVHAGDRSCVINKPAEAGIKTHHLA